MRYGKKTLSMFALASLSSIAFAACGGGSDGTGTATEPDVAPGSVEITARELSFDPAVLRARAGEVQVTLVNAGVIEHDFKIDGKFHLPAAAGKTASASASLDAGSYTFYCSVPGHRQGGMEGTLTAS